MLEINIMAHKIVNNHYNIIRTLIICTTKCQCHNSLDPCLVNRVHCYICEFCTGFYAGVF